MFQKKEIKITPLIIIALLFGFPGFPQAPAIEWAKTYGSSNGDNAADIKQTADGYIFVGTAGTVDGDVTNNYGGYDLWVVKLNAAGNITWNKSLGSIDNDEGFSIEKTFDGGYVVAGYSNMMTGSLGGHDYFVAKLDSNGDTQWQNFYGGSGNDEANSVQQTTDGGYIVAGISSSMDGDVTGNHGSTDAWIVKLDAAGNISWQKCFGGTGGENARCIRQTSDGGYIFTGVAFSIDGDIPGGWPHPIPWVVKLDNNGNITWQKEYGSRSIYNEDSYSVEQTTDGGYIVSAICAANGGDVTGHHQNTDYWIIKLDIDGNLQWQKSLGGSLDERKPVVKQTANGSYVLCGYSVSVDGDVTGNHGNFDYWIIKLSASGELEWQKSLGGSEEDASQNIQPTSDGGYLLCGFTWSNDFDVTGNHGSYDAWVVKLSPDPLPITLNYFNATLQDKSVLCTWQTLQEQNSSYFEVQRSDNGRRFTTIGTVAAAGNSPLLRNYSFTDKDAFTGAKENLYYRLRMVDTDGSYDYSNIENVKLSATSSISVYPNPVADMLFINFNAAASLTDEFIITDNAGRKVYKQTLIVQQGNNSFPIDVSWLADGMYILSVNGKDKYYGRFIKRGK